ncbi:MAG: fibronectin type III domain-containing protein, partial [bacterium]
MRLTLSRSSKISRWGIFAESRKFQILLWACGWITIAPSIQPAQGQECSSQPVAVGYRDFNYGSQVYQAPTAEKPEHKLWWNDGLWWGSLWDSNSNRYRIHRFNVASQCWTNVGPDIDDRSLTLADVLWDGQHLYVVSHIFMTGSNGPGRLYRYSYNTISQSYSLDAGFPVNVNNENSETLSLAKDSEGQLWVTWQADDMVMVNRTLGNDLTWGTPFQLAVQGNDMNSDDISSIIAFGGNKVGIMWGNQEDEAMYFAVHLDADPDATWQPRETALSDANLLFADDHINLKSTIDGAVYAATKTGVDNSNDPNIYLLKRGANGIWSKYLVGTKAQNHSRPILLIDEQNRNIYVFMPALDEVPRPIYMKSSDLDNIQFPAGFGTVFIESASDELINNPTSTRQNVNGTTGILVLASDEGTRNYFHNYMSLNGGSQPPPTAPSNLTASAINNNQIDLSWADNSNDEDGFRIERKKEGETSFTEIATVGANATSYSSTGLLGNLVYFYRVRAHSDADFSAYSNEDSALTLMKGPANLVATAVSSSQINLTWSDQTSNETGFSIERKIGAAGSYAQVGTAGANATNFPDNGLTTGTQYFYRIRAHNATNVSAYSNEANATTFSGQPTTPDSLSATAVSNLQINLAWKDKSSNEDGFKIERKQGALGTYAEIAAVGPNVTSYVNATGLSGNTKYFYRVRAYSAAGNSAYCNEANATTLLKASTNLVATPVSSSQIDLTWT